MKAVKLEQSYSEDAHQNASIALPAFLRIFIGLLLLSACIYLFSIEKDLGLFDLMKIIVPGFAVYAFLPIRFRMPFFLFLSLTGLYLLFGWVNGLFITAFTLLFVGITILPISWVIRAVLSLILTLTLVAMRIEYLPFEGSVEIAKITGALLMFRSILYLYELKHEKSSPSFWMRINYFLLLPNLIFFIFPIVDYKTFLRSYYEKPSIDLYKKGLKWMFRGITHFLAYRLLYYYALPSPSEVNDIYGMLFYFGVSYALILRLSGIFHFSAGVICLFGFDLPKTFDNYFLATSFSDLWRRINIYWKDFVMKVFYFPIFFKFKKRDEKAVFFTILMVFFFNWFFHAYQWFWIRGVFLIKENDILFWAILGLFVAINGVIQKRKKRVKKKAGVFSWQTTFVTSGKIIGMFFLMSWLWGFWISPNIATWADFITAIKPPQFSDFAIIILGFIAMIALVAGLFYLSHLWESKTKNNKAFFDGYGTELGMLGLLLVGSPFLGQRLADAASFDMTPVLTAQLNQADEETLFQGYYDELIVNNTLNSRVWEVDAKRPKDWVALKYTDLLEITDDLTNKRLVPNREEIYKQALLSINSRGLRDKEYPLEKPDGHLRFALLGGSVEFGGGVTNEQLLDNLLERKLTKEAVFPDFTKVEIINLAIAGLHLPQQIEVFPKRAFPYSPDVVIYTAHSSEIERATNNFRQLIWSERGSKVEDYPYLDSLAEVGRPYGRPIYEKNKQFYEPISEELYEWGLAELIQSCKEENIVPVFVYVPLPQDDVKQEEEEVELVLSYAKAAGFHVIDISTAFEGTSESEMALAPFDKHFSAAGHKLIADKLLHAIKNDEVLQELIKQKAASTN